MGWLRFKQEFFTKTKTRNKKQQQNKNKKQKQKRKQKTKTENKKCSFSLLFGNGTSKTHSKLPTGNLIAKVKMENHSITLHLSPRILRTWRIPIGNCAGNHIKTAPKCLCQCIGTLLTLSPRISSSLVLPKGFLVFFRRSFLHTFRRFLVLGRRLNTRLWRVSPYSVQVLSKFPNSDSVYVFVVSNAMFACNPIISISL